MLPILRVITKDSSLQLEEIILQLWQTPHMISDVKVLNSDRCKAAKFDVAAEFDLSNEEATSKIKIAMVVKWFQ